ncbi:unnamed protein product [Gemmataceae bacterium]|nr:unnamed protein product [Gemmataceae bacterium]VTT98891.1 unnamed protein product [Gemmataceae bacterium]
MRIRRIGRWDGEARVFRGVRITWDRGTWGEGGYSAKFTIGFAPRFFRFRRELFGWMLTVFGVRLHYLWSYGGRFAD